MRTLIQILVLSAFIIITKTSNATHAAGADLTYECLGGNQYQITLAVYRDCGGVNVNNNYNISLTAQNCLGQQNHNFNINLPRISQNEVTPICANMNTNCNGGNVTGIEEHIYQAVVTLPDQCTDWTFTYCLPARNNIIDVIQNPGNQDLCVTATLNNQDAPCNSSPSFSNEPVTFICVGSPFCFNHGASDADGDSLVYTAITPMNNANGGTVNYIPPYSVNNPLDTDPNNPFSLNQQNGNICFTPLNQLVSVIAIRVDEYRNGVLIGSVIRDIQINVGNCNNQNPELLGLDQQPLLPNGSNAQAQVCTGDILNLELIAIDPNNGQQISLNWNGGLPNGNFIDNGNGSATVTWLPMQQAAGMTFCFTVTATDDYCPYPGSYTTSYCVDVLESTAIAQGDSVAICGLLEAPLEAYGGNNFNWSVVQGDPIVVGANFSCNPCPNPVASPDFTTTYLVTSDNQLCNNADQVTVHVLDNIGNVTSFANVDQSPICEGLCTQVNGGGQISDTLINYVDYTAAPNAQITHFNHPSSTINVNGIGTPTVGPGVIESVCINIEHTYTADLTLILTCPDGTEILLSDQNGGAGDDYMTTCFTVDAVTPVTVGFPPFNGDFIPEQGDLNQILTGCTTNGNWTLTVEDQNNGQNGWLLDWTITFADTVISTQPVSQGLWSGNGLTGTNLSEPICPTNNAWYTFRVEDQNECFSEDSVFVEVQPKLALTSNVTHENCVGENGVILTNVTNQVGNLTYNWLPNVSNNNSANGLIAGSYQLNVQDDSGAGCELDTVFNVNLLNNQPVLDALNINHESCFGVHDGEVSFIVSNGTTPITYTIDGPLNMVNNIGQFSSLPPGNYNYIIEDSLGCDLTGDFIINEGIQLLLNTNIIEASCGDANGSLELFVVGGSVYQYSIDGGLNYVNSNYFDMLTAGAYSVVVEDASGCSLDTTININNQTAQTIVGVTVDSVTCNGGDDGEINVQTAGGTGLIEFSLDQGTTLQNNGIFNGLSAGNYNIWTQDENGCMALQQVNVYEPLPIQANILSQEPLCYGDCNGEISVVNISGGNGGYISEINNNQSTTTHVFNNICAGIHDVVITDQYGCTETMNTIVGQPDLIQVVALSDSVTCFNGSDGSANASAIGGTSPFNFLWNSGHQTATAMNLQDGNYSVQVTDANGCVGQAQTSVEQPAPMNIQQVLVTDEQCYQACDGQITINEQTAVAYSIDGGQSFQSSSEFNGVCSGVYSVVVKNSDGCEASMQVDVEPAPDFILQAIGDTTICLSGIADLTAWVNGGSGAIDFFWQNTITGDVYNQAQIQVAPWFSSSFNVFATDANGCISNSELLLVEVLEPLKISSLSDHEICLGDTVSIEAMAEGGDGNYQYVWNGSDGTQLNGSIISVSPEQDTEYELTLSDGCSSPEAENRATVVVHPLPNVHFTPDAVTGCTPQMFHFENLTDLSGSYSWTFGDGGLSTSKNPSHVYEKQGCYDVSLEVTTQNGCISDTTFEELICVIPYPFADFTYSPNDKIDINYPLIQFENQSLGAVSYDWTFNHGAGISIVTNPEYLFPRNEEGSYPVYLVAENEYGCTDTAVQIITIKDEVLVYVPNAFTPDGDSYNNVFQPVLTSGFNPQQYRLLIFNRWGELIFESQNSEVGWDGTFKGRAVQDGVYVWTIEFGSSFDSKKHRMEGHVTLLK